MEGQANNTLVEKLIDEQLRQMNQMVRSRNTEAPSRKPNGILGKLRQWWQQTWKCNTLTT